MSKMKKKCVIVVSDFGLCDHVKEIGAIAEEKKCSMHIVNKKHPVQCDYGIHSKQVIHKPNVGREQGVYLDYIVNNYDDLPERIYMTPSNLSKHDRKKRFESIINGKEISCASNGRKIKVHENFSISEYEDGPQIAAVHSPFGKWYDHIYGNWAKDKDKVKSCYNGMIGTTRELIHRHPRSFYEELSKQVNVGSAVEVGHFLERTMGKTFAAGTNINYCV